MWSTIFLPPTAAISIRQTGWTTLRRWMSATNAEVKKAYRKKAAEFHPDKVQGAGLSNDFIQLAKEQFQKISNAYETIAKARNM